MEQSDISKCVVKNWKKQNVREIYAKNKMFGYTFCFIHRSNKNTKHRRHKLYTSLENNIELASFGWTNLALVARPWTKLFEKDIIER